MSPLLRRASLATLALVSLWLPQVARGAEHPSLLFGPEELPSIRANLEGPLRPIRDALQAGIHFPFVGNFPTTPDRGYEHFSDRRAIADSMLAFAFGVIGFDPASPTWSEASTLAKNYLVGICGYGDWVFPETQDGPDPDLNSAHFLFAVALTYDWIHDQLNEAERQRCRDRVEIEGKKVHDAILREVWWMPEYLQNHNWINTASLGMAALAFEGELRFSTSPWLDAAVENLEKVSYVIDLIEGGAWHEGTGYLHYGFDSLIPFAHALERRHGGVDLADTRIVRDYPALRRYMAPPAQAHRRGYVLWGDFSGLDNDNTLLPLFYAARKYRDGHAMWYARRFIDGASAGRGGFTTWPPGQRGLLTAILFYDASVEAVEPPNRGAAWELDFHAKDLALWTSRSGWQDGGSLLAFKTGVFGGHANWERLRHGGWPGGSINFGHDHADDMGVHFFADGEWLTTRVPGYWIGRNNGAPQANRTIYANSLLVDGRGQLGEGIRDCWMGSCTWFWDRKGTINLAGSTSNHSYVLGAGSQLYPRSLGLETFGRAVLFLDRRLPLVRDVVRASGPRRFEIVYHAMDGAGRDGDWIRLDAKNDRALGVKVVAPAAFEVRTEVQTAVHLNKFDPDGAMTAALIRPANDTAETVFLTALVPQRRSSWGQGRPTITALDPQDPGAGIRVEGLAEGEVFEVIFNEAPAERGQLAGLEVQGMAGIRKLVRGETVGATLASGSSIAFDQTTWIEVLEGGPSTVELEREGAELRLSGDEVPLRIFAPGVERVLFNAEQVSFERQGEHILVPGAWGDDDQGAGGGGEGGEDGGGAGDEGAGSGGEGGSPSTPGSGVGCAGSGGGQGGAGGSASGGEGGAGGSEDAPGNGGGDGGGQAAPGPDGKGALGCTAQASGNPLSPIALALIALLTRARLVREG